MFRPCVDDLIERLTAIRAEHGNVPVFAIDLGVSKGFLEITIEHDGEDLEPGEVPSAVIMLKEW